MSMFGSIFKTHKAGGGFFHQEFNTQLHNVRQNTNKVDMTNLFEVFMYFVTYR